MFIAEIIIPILMMLVGFLMGIVVCDSYISDDRIDKMERKLRRLERRMEDRE